jgi:proteic killer suppression protein
MIKTFHSKQLADLWSKGRTTGLGGKLQNRILLHLDLLESAERPKDVKLPGLEIRPLKGFDPVRYRLQVDTNCYLTFEFEQGDASRIDFEREL